MSKQELNDELHTGFEYFIDQFEPLDRGRILAQFAAFGKEAEHFILMLKRPRHGKEELNRDWIEIVSPRVK